MPSPRLPAPRPVSHTGLRLTGVRPTARLSTLVVAGALALPAVLGAQVRAQPAAAPRAGAPPVAPRVPRTDTAARRRARRRLRVHEDKQDPRVLAYLEAENAYTEAMTAHTAALRDTLYREMLGRLKQTDLSVPYRKDGYWYYTRTEEGKSYPIFCRRAARWQAPEEVVLDQNARAAGKKYHGLGGLDVSPTARACSSSRTPTALRVFTLYVRDLRTGRDLDTVPTSSAAPRGRTTTAPTSTSPATRRARQRRVAPHDRRGRAGRRNVFREDSLLYNVGLQRTRDGSSSSSAPRASRPATGG
jgi:oligopeptidase B